MTATIVAIEVTPTHDGEGAFLVVLGFADGARSKVQIGGGEMAAVLARAAVTAPAELIGQAWTVLAGAAPQWAVGYGGD